VKEPDYTPPSCRWKKPVPTVIHNKKQSRLFQLLAQRYTPPFQHELPSTVSWTSKTESWLVKLSKNSKLLKRWLGLKLSFQSHLLRDNLPPPPARLLWVHYSSGSIGDSIMELAGRAMLGDYEVNLLTNKQYAELYRGGERFFRKVFTSPTEINSAEYDFIILDILNGRSLQLKRRLCPDLPFASLQGFYYGTKYNRMLFSCYRIHHLLGYPHSDSQLSQYLHPRLFVEDIPSPLPPKRKSKRWALLLGGEKPLKTFRHWPDVIKILRDRWPSNQDFPEFALVGSQNGLSCLDPVMATLDGSEAKSCVGNLTLRQTARVISDCDFFLGTDGGLMHCAVALAVPGVTIFGKFQPAYYLPLLSNMVTVYDQQNVNNVPPNIVAEAILNHSEMSGITAKAG